MNENGLMNGTTETTSAPNDNITRKQIATILYRYAIYKGMDAVNLSKNLATRVEAAALLQRFIEVNK